MYSAVLPQTTTSHRITVCFSFCIIRQFVPLFLKWWYIAELSLVATFLSHLLQTYSSVKDQTKTKRLPRHLQKRVKSIFSRSVSNKPPDRYCQHHESLAAREKKTFANSSPLSFTLLENFIFCQKNGKQYSWLLTFCYELQLFIDIFNCLFTLPSIL